MFFLFCIWRDCRYRTYRRACATRYAFCRVNNTFAICADRNCTNRTCTHARVTSNTFLRVYFISHFLLLHFWFIFNFCLTNLTDIGTLLQKIYINATHPTQPIDFFVCHRPTRHMRVLSFAYRTP